MVASTGPLSPPKPEADLHVYLLINMPSWDEQEGSPADPGEREPESGYDVW